MKLTQYDNTKIVKVTSDQLLITDLNSALDLIATVMFGSENNSIIIEKTAITEDFFELKTKLAGEILQKFITYEAKIAIIGDFSQYNSKSLNDFIYECNKGKDIFFLETEEMALDKLKAVS